MTKFVRMTRSSKRMLGPVIALTALSLSAQAAFAVGDGGQAKPQIKVESERSPRGAKLTFIGKGWPANARVLLTATRAPGTSQAQKFATVSADSLGNFTERTIAPCSTNNVEDTAEQVTFTAADSATGTKVTTRVQGGAWQCQ